MRIGASFNLPSLPQRAAAPTVAPVKSGSDRDAARSPAAATEVDPGIDLGIGRTRSSQQSDSSGFYSTHRELSLRGQEAMQTYLTTAGFQFGNARSELVGIDIYA